MLNLLYKNIYLIIIFGEKQQPIMNPNMCAPHLIQQGITLASTRFSKILILCCPAFRRKTIHCNHLVIPNVILITIREATMKPFLYQNFSTNALRILLARESKNLNHFEVSQLYRNSVLSIFFPSETRLIKHTNKSCPCHHQHQLTVGIAIVAMEITKITYLFYLSL